MDVKQWKDPIYGYIDIPIKYVRDIIDTAAFQAFKLNNSNKLFCLYMLLLSIIGLYIH